MMTWGEYVTSWG